MNRKSTILALCLSLVVAMAISACSGQATPASSTSSTVSTPTAESASSSTSGSPAEAARTYLVTAMTTDEDIAPMICSTVPDETKEQIKAGMAAAKANYAQSGTTLDLSSLTFTTQNESGDTADVAVSGKLKITINGATTEIDYPVPLLKMKNENGWKVCG